MANKRRSSSGRVTPSKRAANAAAGDDVPPIEKIGQVGRQPSSPTMLFVIAVAWIGCGASAFVFLKASWKVIPGLVMIGIGLFFLRGAFSIVMRHEARRRDDRAGPR